MKRIILSVSISSLLVLAFIACKKNKTSEPPIAVLSKQYINDTLYTEYLYNNNKQLERFNYYNKVTGEIAESEVFEYDMQGHLKTVVTLEYGEPLWRDEYFTDEEGRFISRERAHDSGPDSGTVFHRLIYTYNNKGDLKRETEVELTDDSKQENFYEYSFYTNGNIKSVKYYRQVSPVLIKGSERFFNPEGTALPENYSKSNPYPYNWHYSYLTAGDIHITYYSVDGITVVDEVVETITKRKYDEQGLITQQTVTTEFPFSGDQTEVNKWRYEYINL